MKRFFKWCVIIFAMLLLLIGAFLLVSWINHQIQLKKEAPLLTPIGQQVMVNGHVMNIYTDGQGDTTLVFLSGAGTCSPVLDFKTLCDQFTDHYHIAVVEKAGYGFSEDSNVSRDLDTMLSETREALSKAGVVGPYVLVPHSMSGLEAIYWVQKYPDEVTAIVGLDMSVPAAYENFSMNPLLSNLAAFGVHSGVVRWFPSVAESDAIRYGSLTEEEKAIYRGLFYRKTMSQAMRNETAQVKVNASLVAQNGDINVPMLLFSSNGEGTGWDTVEWQRIQRDFADAAENRSLTVLDCSHYVHDIAYQQIAKETKQFLHTLQLK